MRKIFWLNIGSLVFYCLIMSFAAQASGLQLKSQVGVNEGRLGEGRFNKYNSKEIRLSAHQRISTYPFSFGLSIGREMIHTSSLAFNRSITEDGQILRQIPNYVHNDELDVEFQAWMPDSMTGGRVRPFIKFGHTVWSNYKLKAKLLRGGNKEPYSEIGQEQGSNLALGSQIKLNREFSAVFEFKIESKSLLLEDSSFLSKKQIKSGGALFGFTRLI